MYLSKCSKSAVVSKPQLISSSRTGKNAGVLVNNYQKLKNEKNH